MFAYLIERPWLRALLILVALCVSCVALLFSGHQTGEPKLIEKTASVRTQAGKMTKLERKFVEQGFRLLPYDHPFVLAYEKTYDVDIDSYVAEVNGVKVSGVPFEFGGNGELNDFAARWWTRTGVGEYPVGGLDCAEYIVWIYRQLGYTVPDSSTGLFFAGKEGVLRKLPGIREHLVISSFEEAMIGDVAYNSQNYSYRSGHGSHTQMFLGSANKLGISGALLEMYPDFPCDAYLVLDCGWSDGRYYYDMMKKLHVRNARKGMAGVGVQFFTSIKEGSEFLYKSPQKVYKWENPETGHTFRIESRLEANGRLVQYKPKSKVEYTMNLSRPIDRTDD